jgi:hypothetical protein
MLTSTGTGGRRSPNILQDETIYRQTRGDPAGLAECRGPRPFNGKRLRSSNQRAQTVRNTSATKRVSPLLPASPEAPSSLVCRSLGGCSCRLFDFGNERLETLTPGVCIFGQPGLEQTQKTKSVVYTQRRGTPRTLVRLMRDRWADQ